MAAMQIQALGEIFTLARKTGLELPAVRATLSRTDMRSPLIEGVGQSLIDRDFTTAFSLHNLLKRHHADVALR